MLYHPNDNSFTIITRRIIFWTSLVIMSVAFLFLFNSDAKIPQKEVVLSIDIKNKINICLPDKLDDDKESMFNF